MCMCTSKTLKYTKENIHKNTDRAEICAATLLYDKQLIFMASANTDGQVISMI